MGNRNSGRRPRTTTALKILKGVQKQRINFNEPPVPEGTITKPAELGVGAARMWDELAPLCQAMGTLTVADARPFAMLCELQATMNRASALKEEPGQFMKAVALEKQFANIIRQYYALFGMDPMSRQRIRVAKNDAPPVSKWAGRLT
jgi:phage terminase small subunit